MMIKLREIGRSSLEVCIRDNAKVFVAGLRERWGGGWEGAQVQQNALQNAPVLHIRFYRIIRHTVARGVRVYFMCTVKKSRSKFTFTNRVTSHRCSMVVTTAVYTGGRRRTTVHSILHTLMYPGDGEIVLNAVIQELRAWQRCVGKSITWHGMILPSLRSYIHFWAPRIQTEMNTYTAYVKYTLRTNC